MKKSFLLAAALLAVWCVPVQAQRLSIISWNLESGDSSDAFIATRVRTFQGIDIWGLSEVANQATLNAFEPAAEDGESGADFQNVLGNTGGADRLGIVFNATRFELVQRMELHRVTFNADTATPGSGQRSPLAVELRERATNKRLIFLVNHLARENNTLRRDQARRLNEWVRTQSIPVIAVGDFNFDWEVTGGETNHDPGYDNMVLDQAFVWARPASLIKTQCSVDFNSVLDFVFVNAAARAWSPVSTILVIANDCNDDNQKPDHRPLKADFDLTGGGGTPPTRAELLTKIEELQRQIQQLLELVQRLPQ